ncbi:hypothetical protein [Mesorhizobium huakuii]|uniref:Uncharacterized protein n=1 Tax=Mesorhizobium huakuii TaxID=28104 RepID=A0A7G6T1H6_9HYPH|nr:hypothetical protein [Mesorhizobium huakuii]QND60608.1 hypothetical protein HB778_31935 [Mesorhizobium huakuii]
MADDHSDKRMTSLDCDIIRSAFRKSIVERRISEGERRQYARLLALELTELDEIDPDIIDWIVAR